jgi:hypothetical protein
LEVLKGRQIESTNNAEAGFKGQMVPVTMLALILRNDGCEFIWHPAALSGRTAIFGGSQG